MTQFGKLEVMRPRIFRYVAAIAVVLTLSFVASGQSRTVNFITEPNATIWIDGVLYGRSDAAGKFTSSTVAPGRRAIRVRADGFAEANKSLLATQKGDYRVALVKTTDEAELQFQEGERQSTQDRAKAVAAYRAAIKLKPRYTQAHIALIRTLADGREPEEARKAIAELRKFAPINSDATVIEGRIYKDNDDEDKAIAAFKRSITQARGFQPEAYTGLGLLYKERAESLADDEVQSKAAYAEASKNLYLAVKQLSGAPDAMIVGQLLGLIYEQQGKYKEAIALYKGLLRDFPDASEAEAVRSFITQLEKQMAEQP